MRWLLEHSRQQRLGGTLPQPDPHMKPAGSLGGPVLLAPICRTWCVYVCSRVCSCVLYVVTVVWYVLLCCRCPGALSFACHFPRCDLSLCQPPESIHLDP